MYTIVEKAIHFATIAHSGQKRRNENIDVIFHPITVGMMLKNLGFNDTLVAAGILHDIIEDTDYNYSDLVKNFNQEIADIVLTVSENNEIEDWRERKEDFLIKLENVNDDIIVLEIADKLHNLLSDYEKFKSGDNIFANSLTNYENLKWFYTQILVLAEKREISNILIDRYKEILMIYFGGNDEK